MTRRFLFVLFVALLLTLASKPASAQTQTNVADTGLVVLSTGQVLRLTAINTGTEPVTIRFKKSDYVDAGSTGLIVRKQVAQTVTDLITLLPGQAASTDFYYTIKDIRGEADVSSRNVRLNAFVISPAATSSSSGGSSVLPMEQISFNFRNVTLE